MFLQLSLFSLLAIVAADTVPTLGDTTGPTRTRVPLGTGGSDVGIEDVPHQVSVHVSDKILCGGSIISSTWLVTAATCIRTPMSLMTVRAGSTKQSSGGKIHLVKQAIPHPNYTINPFNVPNNDVAVIEVTVPFDLHEIPKKIEISRTKVTAGVNATITGWGAPYKNSSQVDTLQRLYLPTISPESCDKAYDEIVELPEAKICSLVQEGGKGVCDGDEGDPLTINDQLAGIVSWHYGCGRKGYPDVHTEIYPFREWIIKTTGISG